MESEVLDNVNCRRWDLLHDSLDRTQSGKTSATNNHTTLQLGVHTGLETFLLDRKVDQSIPIIST
jgi:hypothetical protein